MNKISKKLKNKILQTIDDYFSKELESIMIEDYPPECWSNEEKKKVNAFLSSSNNLQNKIEEVINAN